MRDEIYREDNGMSKLSQSLYPDWESKRTNSSSLLEKTYNSPNKFNQNKMYPPKYQPPEFIQPEMRAPLSPRDGSDRQQNPPLSTAKHNADAAVVDYAVNDEAFFNVALALLQYFGGEYIRRDNHSVTKLLKELLSREELYAFGKALSIRFDNLPTFPEPGEDDFSATIRRCDRQFGKIIKQLVEEIETFMSYRDQAENVKASSQPEPSFVNPPKYPYQEKKHQDISHHYVNEPTYKTSNVPISRHPSAPLKQPNHQDEYETVPPYSTVNRNDVKQSGHDEVPVRNVHINNNVTNESYRRSPITTEESYEHYHEEKKHLNHSRNTNFSNFSPNDCNTFNSQQHIQRNQFTHNHQFQIENNQRFESRNNDFAEPPYHQSDHSPRYNKSGFTQHHEYSPQDQMNQHSSNHHRADVFTERPHCNQSYKSRHLDSSHGQKPYSNSGQLPTQYENFPKNPTKSHYSRNNDFNKGHFDHRDRLSNNETSNSFRASSPISAQDIDDSFRYEQFNPEYRNSEMNNKDASSSLRTEKIRNSSGTGSAGKKDMASKVSQSSFRSEEEKILLKIHSITQVLRTCRDKDERGFYIRQLQVLQKQLRLIFSQSSDCDTLDSAADHRVNSKLSPDVEGDHNLQILDKIDKLSENISKTEQKQIKQEYINELWRLQNSLENDSSAIKQKYQPPAMNTTQETTNSTLRVEHDCGKRLKNQLGHEETQDEHNLRKSKYSCDSRVSYDDNITNSQSEISLKNSMRGTESIEEERSVQHANRSVIHSRDMHIHRKSTPEAPPLVVRRSKAGIKEARRCMATVRAPSDLPAGYRFEARLGDEIFHAIVPEGGVKKGEVFESPMCDIYDDNRNEPAIRPKKMTSMNAPQSRWRDELFDCFSLGVNHPITLNSFFCPQVALVQIMSRMQLTAAGRRAFTLSQRLRVRDIIAMTMGWIVIHAAYAFFFYKFVYVVDGLFFDYVFYSFLPIVAIDTALFIFFFYLVAFTRKTVRSEYDIPQLRCKGCEDFALSICCTTCTIAQMGRHTADYETYVGHCCTDNGLPYHIEVKLPSDPTYCIPSSPLSTMKRQSSF